MMSGKVHITFLILPNSHINMIANIFTSEAADIFSLVLYFNSFVIPCTLTTYQPSFCGVISNACAHLSPLFVWNIMTQMPNSNVTNINP